MLHNLSKTMSLVNRKYEIYLPYKTLSDEVIHELDRTNGIYVRHARIDEEDNEYIIVNTAHANYPRAQETVDFELMGICHQKAIVEVPDEDYAEALAATGKAPHNRSVVFQNGREGIQWKTVIPKFTVFEIEISKILHNSGDYDHDKVQELGPFGMKFRFLVCSNDAESIRDLKAAFRTDNYHDDLLVPVLEIEGHDIYHAHYNYKEMMGYKMQRFGDTPPDPFSSSKTDITHQKPPKSRPHRRAFTGNTLAQRMVLAKTRLAERQRSNNGPSDPSIVNALLERKAREFREREAERRKNPSPFKPKPGPIAGATGVPPIK